MRILVTGAAGFIGSYFVRLACSEIPHASIVAVARNTSQKNLKRLDKIPSKVSLHFLDISRDDLSDILEDIDYVVHFAAKTFVDHSIRSPQPFIESNIVGTYRLLEEVRRVGKVQKYIQVSTDEVYGSILEGAYREDSRLNPTNPYSATKAAGDMLTLSYFNTYKIPIIITRTENNYGPFQHPQKALPVFVRKALNNQKLPVYGDGKHRRMWLHVEDHCRAIMFLMKNGKVGEIYHVAGEQELENLDLAKIVLRTLGKPEDNIEFIDDRNIRPGHDRRYALDVTKLKSLGWKPTIGLNEGLERTIQWYRNNQWWFE